MHTVQSLIADLRGSGVNTSGTLFVHSSLKAMGRCESGADTVIDALMAYMRDGLLIMPAHSWDNINEKNSVFDPQTEPSCVGALTNVFMKRAGVMRSLHPTHSVTAYGKNAAEYVSGEENTRTPCPRNGCYGKLYDLDAQILFLGCPLSKNTFLHGVEEWNNIPNRLADMPEALVIKIDGKLLPCPQYNHHNDMDIDISENYIKMEKAFIDMGAGKYCKIGDARSVLCSARKMADLTGHCLRKKPDLFADGGRLDESLYMDFEMV